MLFMSIHKYKNERDIITPEEIVEVFFFVYTSLKLFLLFSI